MNTAVLTCPEVSVTPTSTRQRAPRSAAELPPNHPDVRLADLKLLGQIAEELRGGAMELSFIARLERVAPEELALRLQLALGEVPGPPPIDRAGGEALLSLAGQSATFTPTVWMKAKRRASRVHLLPSDPQRWWSSRPGALKRGLTAGGTVALCGSVPGPALELGEHTGPCPVCAAVAQAHHDNTLAA